MTTPMRGHLAAVLAGVRRAPAAFSHPRVNDEVDMLREPTVGELGLCGDVVTEDRPCCGGACRSDSGASALSVLIGGFVLGVLTLILVTLSLVVWRVAAWAWGS